MCNTNFTINKTEKIPGTYPKSTYEYLLFCFHLYLTEVINTSRKNNIFRAKLELLCSERSTFV